MDDSQIKAIMERKRAELGLADEGPIPAPVKLPCRVCGAEVIEYPGRDGQDRRRIEAWNSMKSQPPRWTCATCRKAQAQREAEERRQQEERHRAAFAEAMRRELEHTREDLPAALIGCGVPLKWCAASLDLCPDLPAGLVRAAREWCEWPRGIVLLYGPPGAAKTWLAVAMLRRVLETGNLRPVGCRYIGERAFLDGIKATFGEGQTAERSTTAAHGMGLLILDDLAATRLTDWGRGEIAGLIEYRHREELATIITSNVGPDGLTAAVDGRVSSRIAESRRLWGFPRRDLRVTGTVRDTAAGTEKEI